MQLQMHTSNPKLLKYAASSTSLLVHALPLRIAIARPVTLIAELLVLIISIKNNWLAQLHVQAADGLRNITRMATEIMSSKCD